jgi:uncharacterized membrane protein
MKTKLEKAILDSMSNNPNNWKGNFYYNPQDPRILVRKINPRMGWSYNWASPYAYISFISIVLITAGCLIFLK